LTEFDGNGIGLFRDSIFETTREILTFNQTKESDITRLQMIANLSGSIEKDTEGFSEMLFENYPGTTALIDRSDAAESTRQDIDLTRIDRSARFAEYMSLVDSMNSLENKRNDIHRIPNPTISQLYVLSSVTISPSPVSATKRMVEPHIEFSKQLLHRHDAKKTMREIKTLHEKTRHLGNIYEFPLILKILRSRIEDTRKIEETAIPFARRLMECRMDSFDLANILNLRWPQTPPYRYASSSSSYHADARIESRINAAIFVAILHTNERGDAPIEAKKFARTKNDDGCHLKNNRNDDSNSNSNSNSNNTSKARPCTVLL
jgi:hypothetical protein